MSSVQDDSKGKDSDAHVHRASDDLCQGVRSLTRSRERLAKLYARLAKHGARLSRRLPAASRAWTRSTSARSSVAGMPPTIPTAKRIADALEVSLAELVKGI
jgi:Zn-dependent oligopeptidase